MMISLLIESGAVDFVVTGCSSGQGMMLACNSLPGLLWLYRDPTKMLSSLDESMEEMLLPLPLGLNFGWQGELKPAIYIG